MRGPFCSEAEDLDAETRGRARLQRSPPSAAATSQGGGNRVSEDQIKEYLRYNLGEAPIPEWGLPDGWGSYLSGRRGLAGCA